MRKVLAIAPYPFLPYYSGGQKFIAGFYAHLAKKTSLTVICTPTNDASLARGYLLLPWLKKSFSRYYDRSLVKKITDEVRRNGYDTIIWEHPYYGWLARKVQMNTGIQTVLHTHNIEYQRFRSMGKWWWPILRNYERRFFHFANKILFITEEDRQFATREWQVPEEQCIDIPFGIEAAANPADRVVCAERIRNRHGIAKNERIFLFNGLLNYKPNLDALRAIAEDINPFLLPSGLSYRILVCGKGLPGEMRNLENWKDRNFLYAGFVEDIEEYFKAADLFLNPVLSGGGIKTKMVEAIAHGTTVVSMETGARGIRREFCGEKLAIVADGNWKQFAETVMDLPGVHAQTPQAFYDYYNWDSIIDRLLRSL
jgi:glycosyltransferase involved in cell wall biosynthesis